MKKLLFILLLCAAPLHAGGPKWRTFDAGLAEAKATHKKVLVDVYTDWCKWCKKLDADTYSNEKVMAYLEKTYVPVKMNGEGSAKVSYKEVKGTETDLTRAFGVRGFPTIIFIDSNGELITSISTYLDADKFLPVIKFIGDDKYKTMSFEEYSKAGATKTK